MLYFRTIIVLSCCILLIVHAQPAQKMQKREAEDLPPTPKHAGIFDGKQNREEISEQLKKWKPEDDNNIWELSGLYQGDMMGFDKLGKNGLLDETARWPDAVIPYNIDQEDFTEEDIEQIKDALKVYHEKTCIRFRPYKKGDKNFITVKGDNTGCWSYVGKYSEGQVVNFQNPGCLRHGTIVHEFMHALGFYHQQSAADRDEWVTIVWDNIMPGREHNFDKYDNKTVTDYGVSYDYSSVMHYSAKAFSKNGQKTIIAKKENVTLGQRDGFSEKDIEKINIMYKSHCETRDKKEKEGSTESSGAVDIISSLWPFRAFSWVLKG
ncbi:zinc metalloproteinase nas-13-like [Nasonia vitripennis]|uniref:Metalloendopeptidase n=1 Tax=Nasonia vitripennis TaxID=7425 RepID=A0A7M7Q4T5_NASVI|nr:zinc metalloproteinase nas-13-like [Nasonia vitripennis]XP_031781683.1 zinc metalloproteinase nas-13-like [Nasonia vitripennis]XP_031781684.1 zinc metalloproteinase nas-13-like [Nasonia vitripennis]XP_031781685.1 zinc metalloproteinase nas-13-like [Nasonia vitripennis]XP_031781686.1 zinc metalloproteinase nas-13-like [Nasonia vitripennis]XP_031781687.1 zinc metalloproteinase nas-13-like [Nasonia vitripennis]XP_031781688.1 zinc metalloproteinase nas-13-like [Nasonia vitripennis]XP_03178168